MYVNIVMDHIITGFVIFHDQKSSRFPQQRKFQSARGEGITSGNNKYTN